MKRGRPSANDLTVKPGPIAVYVLAPPRDLTAAEQAVFREAVATTAPGHFAPSDVPLLATYAQAACMVRLTSAAARKDPEMIGAWEKACRVQAMLSTRLRLSPQSRVDAKTVARRTANHMPSAYDLPWPEIGEHDGETN